MKAGMRTNFADVCKQQLTLASSARPCSMSNSSTRLFFNFFFLPWPPSPSSLAVATAFNEDPRYLPALHAQKAFQYARKGSAFHAEQPASYIRYTLPVWNQAAGPTAVDRP
jgi:hypothetical protein